MLTCGLYVPVAWALDLRQAVDHALQTSSTLAGAQAKQEAMAENVNIAKALLLPKVSMTGSQQAIQQRFAYDQNISFLAPKLSARQTSVGISVAQPLFHWDFFSRYQQGKVSHVMGQLELDEQRQRLRLQVIQRYLDTVQANSDLIRQRSLLDSLKQLAAQTKASFSVGTVSANDTLQVQSQLDLAKADLLALQHTLRLHESTLSSLTGLAVGRLKPLDEQWVVSAEDESWLRWLLVGNFTLRVLQKQLTLNQLQIDVDLGTALPKVDLVAGFDWQKKTASLFGPGSTTRTSFIGINVEVPLYSGGGAWSKLRQTKKQKAQVEYQQDQWVKDLTLKGKALLQGIEYARVQTIALSKAKYSAQQAYRAAEVSFEVGLKDLLNVLNAQARLFEVQDKLTRVKVSSLKLKAELYYLAGVLDDQRVATIAAAFERQKQGGA